jgi:hypothetical protein
MKELYTFEDLNVFQRWQEDIMLDIADSVTQKGIFSFLILLLTRSTWIQEYILKCGDCKNSVSHCLYSLVNNKRACSLRWFSVLCTILAHYLLI